MLRSQDQLVQPSPIHLDTGGIAVETFPNSPRIDVAAVKAANDTFIRREVVESHEATPLAHIDFDTSNLARNLAGHPYVGRNGVPNEQLPVLGRIVDFISDSKAGVERKVVNVQYNKALESVITPDNLNELDFLINAFAGVVIADGIRNGLGNTGPEPEPLLVEARIGEYQADEVEPHIDNRKYSVRYVATFGPVPSTGLIAMKAKPHPMGGLNVGPPITSEQALAMGAKYADQGTVERFNHGQDVHFEPAGKGFRIFLATDLSLEPSLNTPRKGTRLAKVLGRLRS